MERTPLQREIRLRNALKRALGAWVADTAGENGSNDVYLEAEAAIKESEDASAFVILETELQQIMPRLPKEKRQIYTPFLRAAMFDHQINTPLRAAAFLAQIAHESGEFRYMEEIWGRNGGTAQQKRYEPPSNLAKTLGNTEKGDGYRYRGRGVIMITGRFNYRKYGDLLGVDLLANPDLAAKPEYAFQTAALYWKTHGCNELADGENFIIITKKINGGTTNLADRQRYYAVAKKALGVA